MCLEIKLINPISDITIDTVDKLCKHLNIYIDKVVIDLGYQPMAIEGLMADGCCLCPVDIELTLHKNNIKFAFDGDKYYCAYDDDVLRSIVAADCRLHLYTNGMVDYPPFEM